jgi:hypothetical protein
MLRAKRLQSRLRAAGSTASLAELSLHVDTSGGPAPPQAAPVPVEATRHHETLVLQQQQQQLQAVAALQELGLGGSVMGGSGVGGAGQSAAEAGSEAAALGQAAELLGQLSREGMQEPEGLRAGGERGWVDVFQFSSVRMRFTGNILRQLTQHMQAHKQVSMTCPSHGCCLSSSGGQTLTYSPSNSNKNLSNRLCLYLHVNILVSCHCCSYFLPCSCLQQQKSAS